VKTRRSKKGGKESGIERSHSRYLIGRRKKGRGGEAGWNGSFWNEGPQAQAPNDRRIGRGGPEEGRAKTVKKL